MKNSLIVLCIFFIACGPAAKQHRKEQKLARLLKENPALAKTDTIKVDTIVNVPQVHDRIEIDLQSDLQSAEEFMSQFGDTIDYSALDTFIQHSGDVDTTLHTETSKIHIKKKGKRLTVDVTTQPPSIKIEVPISVTSINVPKIDLKWYEKIFLRIRNTVGILGFSLTLLLLLYIAYRIARHISSED